MEWGNASPRALAALAFTAAAFTSVLFLLVIELVAGFAMSPLRAALGVTILPLAALAAAAIPGSPRPRALTYIKRAGRRSRQAGRSCSACLTTEIARR